MGYSDRVIQCLIPSTSTVVLFLLMVPLWYTIYEDNWLDKLDEPSGDVLLILFIACNVGLCGGYGASVARMSSGSGTPTSACEASSTRVPTNPDKGFFVVFRFYGPLEGYIEKKWVLNGFELIGNS